MSYISAEEVKEIRQQLKKALPDFKLSVRKSFGSGAVSISIMTGPVEFDKTYEQVNQYNFKNQYEDNLEAVSVFQTIMNTMNNVNTTYDYYQNIEVGKWNKPYELVQKSA